MNNQIIVGVTTAVGFGVLSWMAYTLIEVDKRTEVMSVTVSKNHEMLKPLWEDFISRRNANGDVKKLDEQTDYKVHIKWK